MTILKELVHLIQCARPNTFKQTLRSQMTFKGWCLSVLEVQNVVVVVVVEIVMVMVAATEAPVAIVGVSLIVVIRWM